jgi:hypothetical protein
MTRPTTAPPTPARPDRSRPAPARRGLARALALVLVAAATATFGLAAEPAAAAECVQYATRRDPVTQQPRVVCVQWRYSDGEPEDPRDEGPSGGGSGTPDPNRDDDPQTPGIQHCWWEVYPIPPGVVPDRPAGVGPDDVMYWMMCPSSVGGTYVHPQGVQWFGPGEVPAPPPSPEQVATELRVDVAASLRDPVVETVPADGEPSILGVPTFVAVANWQGPVEVSGCDPSGAVCVTISAIPSLTFDPGEPRAAVVECEDGGTRYDPGGASAERQAEAAGACAHPYQRRTDVPGRPDAWTASATITWDVSWEGGGQSGTFADIDGSTEFARPVDEVRALVVEANT